MQQCDCLTIRKKAQEGNYAFLVSQIDRCEACAFNKQVSQEKRHTYKQVCLNYVGAYWKQFS